MFDWLMYLQESIGVLCVFFQVWVVFEMEFGVVVVIIDFGGDVFQLGMEYVFQCC